MTITWYGQSCFKLQTKTSQGEIALVIDPFSPEMTGLKPPRGGKIDIVLVSHQHQDHNYTSPYQDSFLIQGSGEFDVKGIAGRGISGWHDAKQATPITIYRIESEDLKFCHLSDLGQKEMTDQQLEHLGEVDVLMIPVGGTYTIDAAGAQKIISQIEPKVVIPMHYQIPGLKIKLDGVEKFLKVMGENGIEAQEKLTVKKRDLGEEEMKIVVLKAGS